MNHWIFLRGLTRDSRHWGEFIATFTAQLPDAEVTALDFAGNGVFHRQRSATRVADMVAFCRAELTKRGIAPPYRLLAASLGGMVATEWAARHPDEIAACVLINTSMAPFNPAKQRLRPAAAFGLLRLVMWPCSAETIETAVLRLTTHHPASLKLVPSWSEYRRACPVSRRNAFRQLLAAWRYRAPVRPLTCPVLILASAQDHLVDPACSYALARAWTAPIHEHPSAGHDLTVDDGPWVAQRVREWHPTK